MAFTVWRLFLMRQAFDDTTQKDEWELVRFPTQEAPELISFGHPSPPESNKAIKLRSGRGLVPISHHIHLQWADVIICRAVAEQRSTSSTWGCHLVAALQTSLWWRRCCATFTVIAAPAFLILSVTMLICSASCFLQQHLAQQQQL